mmetsp:Transcript_19876/g.21311  ORF Transcript_19876/g.21311 Transcript_19876/m.21311 type:complete len:104 (+) Transcript_19876:325-636(+)
MSRVSHSCFSARSLMNEGRKRAEREVEAERDDDIQYVWISSWTVRIKSPQVEFIPFTIPKKRNSVFELEFNIRTVQINNPYCICRIICVSIKLFLSVDMELEC